MYGKKHSIYRVGYYPWLQSITGVLDHISLVDKGNYYILESKQNEILFKMPFQMESSLVNISVAQNKYSYLVIFI